MNSSVHDKAGRQYPCLIFLVLFLIASLSIGCTKITTRYNSVSDNWDGAVAPGKTVEIKGVNGNIRAEPAAGSRFEVHVVKSGRRSDPEEVEIQVVEHENGVTVCAVYPGSTFGLPNECKPGKGGRMNVINNDVKVDFTVRIPKEVHFTGRTVNGSVSAHNLSGDTEGYTVNGGVDISADGQVRAETVNGGITANIRNSILSSPLHFTTVNGSVSVSLPPDVNAEVDAKTVNGGIHTDFPLTVKGKIGSKRIHGKIGNGGPEIQLSTVNGSISIRN
jgi:hypothetical protein